MNDDSALIPIADLDALASGSKERRAQAARAIHDGFAEFGLVYLRGHGVDSAELGAFYDDWVAFTARPEAEKRVLARPALWYQRGWTPPNTEMAVAAGGQPDFKECYFAAPTAPDDEAGASYPELYADNVWPEGGAAFRERYMSLGRALHDAGVLVLRGVESALGLEEGDLTTCVEGGPHVTRALRYLPVTREQIDAKVLWGEEHTDFNLVTLLPGGRFYDAANATCPAPDDASGLYLRTRAALGAASGAMVRGAAPAGCIVAQVGQQLEILTGGVLLATPHVVTVPRTPGYSRTSMAHFVHLHSDARLFPLRPFRTAESIASYGPPRLAGTYSVKTLVDIGLAPKEALDTLGYRHYSRLAGERAATASRA